MNKQPDFGSDLAALNENVTAAVGDVLEALQQNREAKRSDVIKKAEEKAVEPTSSADQPVASESPAVSAPRRHRMASRSRLTLAIERDEPLENVTTRLRQQTNELLTEAALRQRLKKQSPATRQDIIEAALGDWFRKHGYARGRDEALGD